MERIVLADLFSGEVPADLKGFVPLWPGVDLLPLYGIQADGAPVDRSAPSAGFIRYQPGANVPTHRHPGFEHILVLRGSQSDQLGHYGAGTMVVSPPGSSHAVVSEEGCLVLAIWTKSVEVLHV